MASTSQQLFGEDSSDDEDVGSYFVLDRDDDGRRASAGRSWRTARTAGLAPDYEADDPAPARSVAHLGRRILAAETLEEVQVHARAGGGGRRAARAADGGDAAARAGPSDANARGRRPGGTTPRRAGDGQAPSSDASRRRRCLSGTRRGGARP